MSGHYAAEGLTGRLQAALQAAGLGEGTLSPAELAPLDQFHTRGLEATVELAAVLGLSAADTVLDLGSGLGGPSRYLAATQGCRVRGIDLSPAFVEAAGYLAGRAGLAGRVDYQVANALAVPFTDGSFDVVWTQHVAMNIADRAGLYREAFRVLRPGGRLAVYDVVAGPGGALHFPVPWSRGPETSFLLTPAEMRAALEAQGFVVQSWTDPTPAALAWSAARQAAPAPRLGLQVAMGPDFPTMAANLGRNMREGRTALVQAVLLKP